MKHLLTILLVLAALVGCKHRTWDEQVQADVERYNSQECPKQLDELTRIDSMAFHLTPTPTLHYYYTVQGLLDDAAVYTEQALDGFRTLTLKHIRTDLEMKNLRQHGVTLIYHYRSQTTGRELQCLTFTAEEYK